MSESQNLPEQQPDIQAGVNPEELVTAEAEVDQALDPANQALADALRISFIILKLVMICVLGLFLASGAYKVEQNERAVVLLFGRITGGAKDAIKQPGWHWAWPYVEEIIKVPAGSAVRNLNVDSFWYYLSEKEKTTGKPGRPGRTLQIVRDGYSLTASRGAALEAIDNTSESDYTASSLMDVPVSDYNLVHTKWRIRYFISDPISFLEQLWDGTADGYWAVEKLLRSVLADSVILTSANRDIDWIIWGKAVHFRDEVERRMSARLKELDVGLRAELDLIEKVTPRQVKDAFDMATAARSGKNTMLKAARAGANEILSEARANAQIIEAQAQAYRKKVVSAARADAGYLDEVLDKIGKKAKEKFPDTVADYETKRKAIFDRLLAETIDQLYQEMLREVVADAEEVFVLPTTEGKPVELRTHISRDATLRPRAVVEKEKAGRRR